MIPANHGAKRIVVRGNFEIFGQGDITPPASKRTRPEDNFPPAHAFFTTFSARPVLMTFGLRIFIPLRDRKTPKPGSLRPHSIRKPIESNE